MASNTTNHRKTQGKGTGKKMSAKKRRARQRRRIILFAVEICALAVLLVAIVSVMMVTKIDKVKINENDIVVNPQVEENKEMKGYRNIALFGVDSRNGKLGKGSRSDTIMIASINQDTGDVKLVSVYRDTYLNLGTDNYNKCNAAYGQNGAEQAINMLNMNFDLDITQYVTVGFEALIDTIDALGGVEIDVHENEIDHLNNYQRSMFSESPDDPLNENITKVTQAGMQTLNGLQATAYCRIRYVGDDFGRAERQRKVLMACMEKAKKANPATLVEILNNVMENVYTNVDVTEMAGILKDVANYNIVAQDGVPFEGHRTTGTIGKKGSCVVPLDLAENVKLLHEFLFDVTDYTPSDQVIQYSQKIEADTAPYVG
ncbi:MAG: LCP family protein [Eubacteriales bacterium]|nr:LCP family protein [Eubacteriales bacterium]